MLVKSRPSLINKVAASAAVSEVLFLFGGCCCCPRLRFIMPGSGTAAAAAAAMQEFDQRPVANMRSACSGRQLQGYPTNKNEFRAYTSTPLKPAVTKQQRGVIPGGDLAH